MAAIPSQSRVLKFGVFEVNLQAGEVRKAGMRQKLAGQPFQVLQALLEHPQEIVTREELRELIWPGNAFVDYELALKKAVNRLREVLGDSAETRISLRRFLAVATASSVPSHRPLPFHRIRTSLPHLAPSRWWSDPLQRLRRGHELSGS